MLFTAPSILYSNTILIHSQILARHYRQQELSPIETAISNVQLIYDKQLDSTCAEQYVTVSKAVFFGDTEPAYKVMATPHPKEEKEIGRSLEGFFDEWSFERERVAR